MTDGHRGRILVFSPWPVLRELEGGGGTPVLTDLLEYLTEDGYEVELVLPSAAREPSSPPPGVTYHRVGGYPEAATRGDAREVYGISPGTPLVVSSSRLATWKRVDRVLNAFAGVLPEHPEAVLAVAGTGPEQEALEKLSTTLGISASVRFLGPLPRLENLQLVSSADVFVSLYDFSNVGVAL